MAGIEKVCEYSGEYPGWKMYGYKRNRVQIMPRYRKLFKGKQATLFIFKDELRVVGKYGSCTYDPCDKWMKGTVRWQYMYCLYAPELQGNVEGQYWNWGYDKRAFMHKLANMLGLKSVLKLNVTWCKDLNDVESRIKALEGNNDGGIDDH